MLNKHRGWCTCKLCSASTEPPGAGVCVCKPREGRNAVASFSSQPCSHDRLCFLAWRGGPGKQASVQSRLASQQLYRMLTCSPAHAPELPHSTASSCTGVSLVASILLLLLPSHSYLLPSIPISLPHQSFFPLCRKQKAATGGSRLGRSRFLKPQKQFLSLLLIPGLLSMCKVQPLIPIISTTTVLKTIIGSCVDFLIGHPFDDF